MKKIKELLNWKLEDITKMIIRTLMFCICNKCICSTKQFIYRRIINGDDLRIILSCRASTGEKDIIELITLTPFLSNRH